MLLMQKMFSSFLQGVLGNLVSVVTILWDYVIFISATDIHHRPDLCQNIKEHIAVPAKASVVSWNFSKCFSFSLVDKKIVSSKTKLIYRNP